MMCFRPDGIILCKTKICWYDACLLGKSLDYAVESAKIFCGKMVDAEDKESDVAYKDEDAFPDKEEDSDM